MKKKESKINDKKKKKINIKKLINKSYWKKKINKKKEMKTSLIIQTMRN
jgi:hypothetical protein